MLFVYNTNVLYNYFMLDCVHLKLVKTGCRFPVIYYFGKKRKHVSFKTYSGIIINLEYLF